MMIIPMVNPNSVWSLLVYSTLHFDELSITVHTRWHWQLTLPWNSRQNENYDCHTCPCRLRQLVLIGCKQFWDVTWPWPILWHYVPSAVFSKQLHWFACGDASLLKHLIVGKLIFGCFYLIPHFLLSCISYIKNCAKITYGNVAFNKYFPGNNPWLLLGLTILEYCYWGNFYF